MRISRTTASQKRSGSSREKRRKASRSSKPNSCMKRQTLVRSMNSQEGSQIMLSFQQFRKQPRIRLDRKRNVEHFRQRGSYVFRTGRFFVPSRRNSGAHPNDRHVTVVFVGAAMAGASHVRRDIGV